jgi:hypothetical protein
MRSIMQLVRWMCGAISRLSPFTYDAPVSNGKDASGTAEATSPVPDLALDRAVETKRRAVYRSTLWPVKNTDHRRKLWCGPTVVSTLIGVDAAEARDIIKASRNGRAVKGTYARELDIAFRAYGCRLDLVSDHSADRPTLASWLRLPRDPDDALVVEVARHWVAVRGDWFCDTFTKGQPVRLRHAPHKRKRVRRVYRVSLL